MDDRGYSLRPEQVAAVARLLAEAKVDVFAAGGGPAIKAAQAASNTIPIVGFADDMVREGHVGSLANRGGNTTGISILATELDGKRQEILMELLPNARRMALLADATLQQPEHLATLQGLARLKGVELSVLRIEKPEDIESALDFAKAGGTEGINILASPLLFANRDRIFAKTAALRLPAMYQWPEGMKEGALVSYGPSYVNTFEQWGRMVGKVLRGATPAELPVEQPSRFFLSINLKRAGELGVAVPPSLLQVADEVVE